MNNKGADETARMRRLICAFVVRIWHKTCFLMAWLIYYMRCVHLAFWWKSSISKPGAYTWNTCWNYSKYIKLSLFQEPIWHQPVKHFSLAKTITLKLKSICKKWDIWIYWISKYSIREKIDTSLYNFRWHLPAPTSERKLYWSCTKCSYSSQRPWDQHLVD